jgi:NADH-quinone oxidoreductase subunit G
LLGHSAMQHPRSGELLALSNWIAAATGSRCGVLGEGGNSVGAQLVGALPGVGGLNAGQMLGRPMKALVLLHTEPLLDAADAAAAKKALLDSGLVVALTSVADLDQGLADLADVMLPIAPFTETAGSFVNAEGRLQSFHGVVKPLGETRPGWKVLRVLGNLLGLNGFDYETADDVRAEALGGAGDFGGRIDNSSAVGVNAAVPEASGLERIADVPIYATDALVRRASSLQLTADAREPVVGLPSALWHKLRLQGPTAKVVVHQGDAAVVLPAREDATLADGAVRIAAGHASTAALGAMFGALGVEAV